jgi:hypothetical protein
VEQPASANAASAAALASNRRLRSNTLIGPSPHHHAGPQFSGVR